MVVEGGKAEWATDKRGRTMAQWKKVEENAEIDGEKWIMKVE